MLFMQVVEEFYNIFGPELKAVTGDPRHIEDVLKRVDALVKPIEEVNLPHHFCCILCFIFGWNRSCSENDFVYFYTFLRLSSLCHIRLTGN